MLRLCCGEELDVCPQKPLKCLTVKLLSACVCEPTGWHLFSVKSSGRSPQGANGSQFWRKLCVTGHIGCISHCWYSKWRGDATVGFSRRFSCFRIIIFDNLWAHYLNATTKRLKGSIQFTVKQEHLQCDLFASIMEYIELWDGNPVAPNPIRYV